MIQNHFSNILLRTSSLEKGVNLQFLRYRRKPRWIPTAPSKLFRIPQRPVMAKDESVEWLRLNANYKTQMNSLRQFLMHEVKEKQQSIDLEGPSSEEMTDEMEINRQWNLQIAEMREKRILDVKEDRMQKIIKSLDKHKEKEIQRAQAVTEIVKKVDEESKTFITREIIDKSIEEALANPISYDYCIDTKGNNMMKASETPEPVK